MEIKICFKDEDSIILRKCDGFILDSEKGIYTVAKNGYKMFFNKDLVKYIGRTEDLGMITRGD